MTKRATATTRRGGNKYGVAVELVTKGRSK